MRPAANRERHPVDRSGIQKYKNLHSRSTVCFDIYLPALPAPQPAAGHPAAAEAPLPSGRETILVVDDELAILDLGETLLGRFGY